MIGPWQCCWLLGPQGGHCWALMLVLLLLLLLLLPLHLLLLLLQVELVVP